MIDLDSVRAFVRIGFSIEEQEAALKKAKAEKEELGVAIARALAEEGIPHVPIVVDGVRMRVYVARPLRVTRRAGVESDELVGILDEVGLSDLVRRTYNAQTLAGYVRETLADGRSLAERLAGALEIAEDMETRAVRDSTKESTSARAVRNLNDGR